MSDSITARSPGPVVKLSTLHPCFEVVSSICTYMLCLVFTKTWHCYVYCGQISPPWAHMSEGHWARSLVVCSDSGFQCCTMFCLEIKGFLLATVLNKTYMCSLFLTLLLWILTINMLTEACRVWDVALVFFWNVSELHSPTLRWMPTFGKTENCL